MVCNILEGAILKELVLISSYNIPPMCKRSLQKRNLFKATLNLGISCDSYLKTNQRQDCHSKSNIQQEEGSFHQQIRLKFKEETSKVLQLEYSFVWC